MQNSGHLDKPEASVIIEKAAPDVDYWHGDGSPPPNRGWTQTSNGAWTRPKGWVPKVQYVNSALGRQAVTTGSNLGRAAVSSEGSTVPVGQTTHVFSDMAYGKRIPLVTESDKEAVRQEKASEKVGKEKAKAEKAKAKSKKSETTKKGFFIDLELSKALIPLIPEVETSSNDVLQKGLDDFDFFIEDDALDSLNKSLSRVVKNRIEDNTDFVLRYSGPDKPIAKKREYTAYLTTTIAKALKELK